MKSHFQTFVVLNSVTNMGDTFMVYSLVITVRRPRAVNGKMSTYDNEMIRGQGRPRTNVALKFLSPYLDFVISYL